MAEDFNDLLDQTETRAQALTLEADKAIELLDSVDEMVDNLSSTIEASANEAKESFNTLTEQVTTAEDTLQTQQEAAKESMNGLMQQMQDAGEKIQERLGNALAKFGELQSKKQEFLGELGEEIEKFDNGLEEFANEYKQMDENIENAADSFEENEQQFSQALTIEAESIKEQSQSLSNELESFTKNSKKILLFVNNQSNEIAGILSEFISNISQIIQEILAKSVTSDFEKFVPIIEELNNFATTILENAVMKITNNIDGIEDELVEKMDNSLKKMKSIFSFSKDIEETLKGFSDEL